MARAEGRRRRHARQSPSSSAGDYFFPRLLPAFTPTCIRRAIDLHRAEPRGRSLRAASPTTSPTSPIDGATARGDGTQSPRRSRRTRT